MKYFILNVYYITILFGKISLNLHQYLAGNSIRVFVVKIKKNIFKIYANVKTVKQQK